MLRRASIRTQLAILVLAVVLPLLATVIYNHVERIHGRTEQAGEFARGLAGAAESAVSRVVEEERFVLSVLAARPAQRVERPDPCDPLIADLHSLNPQRANVVIGALSGEVVCSAVAQPPGPPTSLLKMAHIQRLLRTGEFTIGEPFKGPIIGRWVVPLSFPRRDAADRLIGWIGSPLDPMRLQDLLKHLAQDAGNDITLLSAQGVVLARSMDTEKWVGTSARDGPFPRALFDGSLSRWEGRGLDGVLRIWSSKQIPGAGWRVLAGADKQTVLAPLDAALTRNAVVIALVVFGVIAASLWIGGGIALPLMGLAETMSKSGSTGNLVRARVGGAAEVANVAVRFNRMLESRQRMEDQLRTSESRFRNIIEASPVPCALNDERQNITYLNAAFVRTFGYDRADISTLADWWPRAYPDADYRRWVATTWQARLDVAKQTGAKFRSLELDIRCKDGAVRTAAVAAEPLEGAFNGEHLVVLYDITERKQAEEALRVSEDKFSKAFHASPYWVALSKLGGGEFVEVNEGFTRISGYSREQACGRSSIELGIWVHPEQRAAMVDKIESGMPVRDTEVMFRAANGLQRLLQISMEMIDVGGEKHLLTVGHDITERRQAETALRDHAVRLQAVSRKLLEVQENERRLLARELHDEVGGVLTAVKLNLQSLRRPGARASGDAALADGLALVDGAIQSVRSLSLDLRPAMLDDLGLIPALKWYCERQAQRAGVAIEVALDPVDLKSAPQVESACFRVVQESVTNALRHADARRVQVALRRDDGIEIEIVDDGCGFDPATVRGGGLVAGGSGVLGMRERVELLGGRLTIESAPGAGTRVRAEIPLPEGAHG